MRYNALTWERFSTAAGAGQLAGGGAARGAAGSRALGTWVQFDISLGNEPSGSALISAARFLAFGCPHTIAAADWVVARAVGRAPEAALPVDVGQLQARFEVPVEKLGRLLIVEDAWLAAIAAARGA